MAAVHQADNVARAPRWAFLAGDVLRLVGSALFASDHMRSERVCGAWRVALDGQPMAVALACAASAPAPYYCAPVAGGQRVTEGLRRLAARGRIKTLYVGEAVDCAARYAPRPGAPLGTSHLGRLHALWRLAAETGAAALPTRLPAKTGEEVAARFGTEGARAWQSPFAGNPNDRPADDLAPFFSTRVVAAAAPLAVYWGCRTRPSRLRLATDAEQAGARGCECEAVAAAALAAEPRLVSTHDRGTEKGAGRSGVEEFWVALVVAASVRVPGALVAQLSASLAVLALDLVELAALETTLAPRALARVRNLALRAPRSLWRRQDWAACRWAALVPGVETLEVQVQLHNNLREEPEAVAAFGLEQAPPGLRRLLVHSARCEACAMNSTTLRLVHRWQTVFAAFVRRPLESPATLLSDLCAEVEALAGLRAGVEALAGLRARAESLAFPVAVERAVRCWSCRQSALAAHQRAPAANCPPTDLRRLTDGRQTFHRIADGSARAARVLEWLTVAARRSDSGSYSIAAQLGAAEEQVERRWELQVRVAADRPCAALSLAQRAVLFERGVSGAPPPVLRFCRLALDRLLAQAAEPGAATPAALTAGSTVLLDGPADGAAARGVAGGSAEGFGKEAVESHHHFVDARVAGEGCATPDAVDLLAAFHEAWTYMAERNLRHVVTSDSIRSG